jgi:hypothetical protein
MLLNGASPMKLQQCFTAGKQKNKLPKTYPLASFLNQKTHYFNFKLILQKS